MKKSILIIIILAACNIAGIFQVVKIMQVKKNMANIINYLQDNQESHMFFEYTATCYQATEIQCGKTDGITASGKKVHSRTCAVSRDLHKRYGGRYEFGDSICIISGVPNNLTGWWKVDDLTADNYKGYQITNTIDLFTTYYFKNQIIVMQ